MTISDLFSPVKMGTFCCCLSLCCAGQSAECEPADKSRVLVEMFTSQNCPACPAANEKLINLSEETDDIFPLTFSVSYWDYLGNKDPFAKKEFSARQRAYADAFNLRGPYTPQAVVDGCLQTTGKVSQESVTSKIQHTQTPHGHDVNLTVTASSVELTPGDAIPEAEIWLVGYQPGITAIVPNRGANRKKMLSHINMVTSLQSLGNWTGETPISVSFTCPDEACVVVVQEAGSKDIMEFAEVPAVSG